MRQVEPLARLLPREKFKEVFEVLKKRRLSSSVRNDAGLFIHLLRIEVLALRAERAASPAHSTKGQHTPTEIERIKRDEPEKYIAAMKRAMPGFDLEAYLHTVDPSKRQALRQLGA